MFDHQDYARYEDVATKLARAGYIAAAATLHERWQDKSQSEKIKVANYWAKH